MIEKLRELEAKAKKLRVDYMGALRCMISPEKINDLRNQYNDAFREYRAAVDNQLPALLNLLSANKAEIESLKKDCETLANANIKLMRGSAEAALQLEIAESRLAVAREALGDAWRLIEKTPNQIRRTLTISDLRCFSGEQGFGNALEHAARDFESYSKAPLDKARAALGDKPNV